MDADSARIIHLNHAGASPSSSPVLNRVMKHLLLEQRIGGYAAADVVQEELDQVYNSVAQLVGASSVDEIALVESATVAWTRIFYAVATAAANAQRSSKRKVILVSHAEYAANVVAACQWSKTNEGWTVLPIPSSGDGKVDVDKFQAMLDGTYTILTNNEPEHKLNPDDIAIVCVTQVPTNSGIVNPVEAIGKGIAEYNQQHKRKDSLPRIFYLVDACQAAGQIPLNVQQMQCHALVGTGRKYLRGPRGTGFLFVQKDVGGSLWPHHVDHNGAPVTSVPLLQEDEPIEDALEFAPRQGASRFEFWESNLASKLGLGVAVHEALDEGLDCIWAKIHSNAQVLYKSLQQIDSVRTYYAPEGGLVTFWVEGKDSELIKKSLWEGDTKFETSVVPATSTPLDSARTRVPNLVRASVSYMTTTDDIALFCTRLDEIVSSI